LNQSVFHQTLLSVLTSHQRRSVLA
jgi:hypothetical protein